MTKEQAISSQVPIAEGLFTGDPDPRLIGGRDMVSGRIVFPCPSDDTRFEPVELPRAGTLWSWTIQRFRPKSPPYIGPEAFEPFAIGYVELPDAVIVEGPLTGVAFDAIRIGMEMRTVLQPLATDVNGRTIVTYAFAPVNRGAAHE
ncbi:DNA-binding protein [Sphingobium sp. SCG-1]|uniref:Zn-ribbon domain-containing OB-fold protein n=1 Tax=Sphingobium sp. SCG-1 TaxID=2072936 RepID=UPI000CD68410|nr:OB-fold domain-containing protein [Sphingobium sp. SCG-1]AUW58930.1 DNA-binding protein [Sphingobium sp. SCG-1]